MYFRTLILRIILIISNVLITFVNSAKFMLFELIVVIILITIYTVIMLLDYLFYAKYYKKEYIDIPYIPFGFYVDIFLAFMSILLIFMYYENVSLYVAILHLGFVCIAVKVKIYTYPSEIHTQYNLNKKWEEIMK